MSLRPRHDEIVAITDAIAATHLDAEYRDLCRRMARALARLTPSPIEGGNPRTWAAGIIHAVGWVNFLDDPSQSPHLTSAQLAQAAGVSKSALGDASRRIRSLLRMSPLDTEWVRPSMFGSHPLTLIEELAELAKLAEVDEDEPLPVVDVTLDDVMSELQAVLDLTLGRNPLAAEDELNAALQAVTDRHNRTPQSDRGGLTPDQMYRLLNADWESDTSALRIVGTLTLPELDGSRTLHDARLLLGMIAERGPVKATPKGNLPRTIVTEFRERMREPALSMLLPLPEQRVLNEEDLFHSLHVVRVVCELAGLLKRRAGAFTVTRRGLQLRNDERAGELFALLVRTHFRVFELSYVDRAAEAPGVQQTLGYGMYRFAKEGGEWRDPGELATMLMTPEVRASIPTRGLYDESALVLETRFLWPLEGFGLAEIRASPRDIDNPFARYEYRKSPLFDRVVRFRLG